MSLRRTEQRHGAASGLDALPLPQVAHILCSAQCDAALVVLSEVEQLALGGALMADTVRHGGALHYAAAGSSGLMAMADACELAGTFGIDPGRIKIHMAGGLPQDASMPGDTEDATGADINIAPGDTAIVISASGSTPYALDLADRFRSADAAVIGIANNRDTPLLDMADVAVCLPTPPEVLAGSTRMGAGTAQKIALNIMSTAMGVALGHVHDGMMVNVRADNAKLRARALGMVAAITGVDDARAQHCLDQADGEVKRAAMLAAGAADLDDADSRLTRAHGILRHALADLNHHDTATL